MQLTDGDQILVTGATGLVGSHVAEQARERGIRVRALCRSAADTSLLRRWGVEIVAGDLDDAASLKTACAGATVIVHCAAMVGDWGPRGQAISTRCPPHSHRPVAFTRINNHIVNGMKVAF